MVPIAVVLLNMIVQVYLVDDPCSHETEKREVGEASSEQRAEALAGQESGA